MTETIRLTVNGEASTVTVPTRTQLAEVLRDHLDLTGTHLACEQGVCGACTVFVDGRPVRSCITYAHACDGAVVETVEGHRGDELMERLREAFSRHHALQCGFCTPGMLATARDILARFDDPDETTVRLELSGNLCRCTGYVGIVDAIRDVAGRRREEGGHAERPAPALPPRPHGFTPFEPVAEAAPSPRPTAAAGSVSTEGGATVVRRSFEIAHPADRVWALFSDLRRVAPCIPGASVDAVDGETFTGGVDVRFGPIRARIGGRGTVRNDEAARSGRIAGEGDDRLGRSRVTGELAYAIRETGPAASLAEVEVRYEIQGLLAQFNRPELVTGFVDHLLGQFAANCEAVLSGAEAAPARRLSLLAMLWAMLKGRFARR